MKNKFSGCSGKPSVGGEIWLSPPLLKSGRAVERSGSKSQMSEAERWAGLTEMELSDEREILPLRSAHMRSHWDLLSVAGLLHTPGFAASSHEMDSSFFLCSNRAAQIQEKNKW